MPRRSTFVKAFGVKEVEDKCNTTVTITTIALDAPHIPSTLDGM